MHTIQEQPGSTKDEVAEWGKQRCPKYYKYHKSYISDYSDSTKIDYSKEGQHLGENWPKYTEYFEVPSKVCEVLGCYNCVYAKFVEAHKGCYCIEAALQSAGSLNVLCLSYDAKEAIPKEATINTSEGKT